MPIRLEVLSPADRIAHVQDPWDRIALRSERVPVAPASREELRRRPTAHENSPP